VLIGMAHRGRLNVLAHVLGKPYAQILAEFKDPVRSKRTATASTSAGPATSSTTRARARTGTAGAGSSHLDGAQPEPPRVRQPGRRRHGARRGHRGRRPARPSSTPTATLPILIHGDAAFPGQGIVAETLNLSRLAGYTTGGTIHIIANNQLGFTTDALRVATAPRTPAAWPGFKIPIVHVNADDPEACIEAARWPGLPGRSSATS
jgi:2-oxoglutarate dehydrogenase E1 component